MKNFPAGLVLPTLLVFAATVRAETSDADVLRVLEKAEAVVAECSIEEYAKLWEDDATVFISSGNRLMPVAEYLEIWGQVCSGGGGMTVKPVERQIRVYGPTAVVTGLTGYTFTGPDGESHSGTTRYTTVLRRAGAEWKLVHAHGSELGVHGGLEDHEHEQE
jgi:ketosteroid isomerase-like protein